MQKEVISNRQGITMMTMFILGSTLILGVGSEAKQDVWLAIIIALIFTIPVVGIYARILSLFPDKNLYEILNTIFGRFLGIFIAIFFIWYSFHLGVLVLRNFSELIKVVSFAETPEFIPVMMMGTLCIWVVKEGIEVLGRWSQLAIILLLSIIMIVPVLSLTKASFNNIRPFLYNGIMPVFDSAFSIFSFPFAETVLFLATFNLNKERNNPFKIYYFSLAISGFFILILTVRNVLVLGVDFINMLYFPSYIAASLINIGDFLQRIEVFVAVGFLFAGFAKISVCLLAASKGIANLFKIDNYRQIVAPIGLLMMITSCFIYQSTMEMQEWAFKVYKYYAFPFQVILPIIIWISAEIKIKQQKKKKKSQALDK